MAKSNVFLGGFPMRVNPDEIRWNFKMKAQDKKTMGGKVIQVLGTHLGDITMRGVFSPDRTKGDREAWQQQVRFREQVRTWADAAVNAKGGQAKPVRLTYAPRGWNFGVYVKTISAVHIEVGEIAPKWELVLFPVDQGSQAVIQGIKDLYIKRLMDGVGWKQTEYNGPTQQEVEDTLGGQSIEEYLATGYQTAFEEGTGQ